MCCFRTGAATRGESSFRSTLHSAAHKYKPWRMCVCKYFDEEQTLRKTGTRKEGLTRLSRQEYSHPEMQLLLLSDIRTVIGNTHKHVQCSPIKLTTQPVAPGPTSHLTQGRYSWENLHHSLPSLPPFVFHVLPPLFLNLSLFLLLSLSVVPFML